MSKITSIIAVIATLGLAPTAQAASVAYQGFEGAGTWGFTPTPGAEFNENGVELDGTWSVVTPDPGDTDAIDGRVDDPGWTGDKFWGISNFGATTSGALSRQIDFDDVDVNGYTNVKVTFDYFFKDFDRNTSTNVFAKDNLTYSINGGPAQSLVPLGAPGTINVSSGGWQTITVDVFDTSTPLDLVIGVEQRGADAAAFDNFIVTETGSIRFPCPRLDLF